MQSEHEIAGAIKLVVSTDGKHLLAAYTPQPIGLDADTVTGMIAAQGYGDWFVKSDAIAELVARFSSARDAGVIEVAERRDARIEVSLSRYKMEAYLTLVPPMGGEPATKVGVLSALKDKGVLFGVRETEIEAAVLLGVADKLLIACGDEPHDGEDARFISLLPEVKERLPRIDESGIVDYRDLGDVRLVHQGDKLMRRVPATPGRSGMSVLGIPVPQKAGVDTPFSPGMKGVVRLPEDQNVIISAIYGQPVIIENGVIVEPTLHLPTVNLASGNIKFEGTIKIEGDVAPNMRVEATGDVHVGGLIEAAKITAGGDIVVAGGVISHGELRLNDGELNPNSAILEAQGSVSANFVENAKITAGKDILIKELASHSELIAGDKVVVGQKGAKRGSLIGGVTTAFLAVRARILGSPAGIVTKIHVGECKEDEKQQIKITQQTAAVEVQRQRILDLLQRSKFATNTPTETLEKARAAVETLDQQLRSLTSQADQLRKKIELAGKARIMADAKIYTNLHINVANKSKVIQDERGGGAYYLEDNELIYGWGIKG